MTSSGTAVSRPPLGGGSHRRRQCPAQSSTPILSLHDRVTEGIVTTDDFGNGFPPPCHPTRALILHSSQFGHGVGGPGGGPDTPCDQHKPGIDSRAAHGCSICRAEVSEGRACVRWTGAAPSGTAKSKEIPGNPRVAGSARTFRYRNEPGYIKNTKCHTCLSMACCHRVSGAVRVCRAPLARGVRAPVRVASRPAPAPARRPPGAP